MMTIRAGLVVLMMSLASTACASAATQAISDFTAFGDEVCQCTTVQCVKDANARMKGFVDKHSELDFELEHAEAAKREVSRILQCAKTVVAAEAK